MFAGIKRIIKAFKYSFDGFVAAAKGEEAFRQELFLFTMLIPISFFFDVMKFERILMISSVLIVIMAELVNSSIETIVDRISEKKHPLSKKAKDISSTVVFLSFINLIVVWLSILLV